MQTGFIAVFITAPSYKEAKRIADAIVSGRLAACANIIPGVKSIFKWQGKIETAREALLIVKTKKSKFDKLKKQIKKLHSYKVPEIIALPIISGNAEYLNWIDESIK